MNRAEYEAKTGQEIKPFDALTHVAVGAFNLKSFTSGVSAIDLINDGKYAIGNHVINNVEEMRKLLDKVEKLARETRALI